MAVIYLLPFLLKVLHIFDRRPNPHIPFSAAGVNTLCWFFE